MSRSKYPNRDALDKALHVYLEAMYSFVSKYLDKESITDALRLPSDSNIEEKIEVKDIAHLIRTWPHWDNHFKEEFKIIDRGDIRYYDARSVTSLIVEGRNQVAHKALKDLDREFTRAQLFLIAEILGKIDRLNEQREVEKIRDKCFVEIEQDKSNLEELLAAKEKKLKELSEKMINNAVKLGEKNKEIEKLADTLERKEEKNKELAEKFLCEKLEKKKYQDQHNSISNQLATVQTERDTYKEQVETSSDELKEVKVERDTAKEGFVAISNELTLVCDERKTSEKNLAAPRNLLTAVAIGDQAVFPHLGTDATVRIVDHRGRDKRNYLVKLMEQKQPTLIYVQSEEKINELLTRVMPEKAEVIGRHNERMSKAEETKILEKLENRELIAVVSNTTLSTLVPSHCIEHFVFCHLTPGLDEFFKRCQPAFKSEKDSYLHLIYESKQKIKELAEKYPKDELLRKLYQKIRNLTPIGKFINFEYLHSELCKENELDIAKLGFETGLVIFEELGLLKRNGETIERIGDVKTELNKSKTYCVGAELNKEIENSPSFQYEHSIEQIWEKMLEALNVDSEQILRESSIHKVNAKYSEIGSETRSSTAMEQDRITPSTPDVWPQRGMSTFNALRQRASNNFAVVNATLNIVNESDFVDDWESPVFEEEELRSPIFEDQKDYQNKYDLALQFAQEHGINALEKGVAQLITDRDDPDYAFAIDEMKMLRAFQEALRDFQTQSEQPTEMLKKTAS